MNKNTVETLKNKQEAKIAEYEGGKTE